ncbi:helix-turn-helix transcriptional regulator [Pelagibacterium flavum]|uniref:Helix-turn-helix transcriptional regulator n=1 Tax=Pelagibacterium flavum TaxID=2984530 RepID=A0ABY6IMT7_9HYPH|nr:helix-turn-helix domain-containing protein [Pelagibacterium sp. YIM 151497]MAN75610.1 MarR family transcriptional regulator [Hyphomicrobiales bacterium]UYQ71888.1 helix-turn-helix transcriptional regulator [Pelagibacterium sp. YIM 151497]|eukprot:jgi/Tetstr1/452546/TSEL_039582.t1
MDSSPFRSGCPINLGLEVFGDKWTLLIIRDMMFAGKRHFREFLASDEGISTNILADRLAMLTRIGIITRADDPSHRLKAIYSLTEKGIQLLPVIAQISRWSRRYMPVDPVLAATGEARDRAGPGAVEAHMDALRAVHLAGAP